MVKERSMVVVVAVCCCFFYGKGWWCDGGGAVLIKGLVGVDEKIPVNGAIIGWFELKSLGKVYRTQKFASPENFF